MIKPIPGMCYCPNCQAERRKRNGAGLGKVVIPPLKPGEALVFTPDPIWQKEAALNQAIQELELIDVLHDGTHVVAPPAAPEGLMATVTLCNPMYTTVILAAAMKDNPAGLLEVSS